MSSERLRCVGRLCNQMVGDSSLKINEGEERSGNNEGGSPPKIGPASAVVLSG